MTPLPLPPLLEKLRRLGLQAFAAALELLVEQTVDPHIVRGGFA